ncbi:MAG: hypothetical protein KGZ72_03175 [Roseovarius sp.]|jgi:hypothetical protein|nr:hypothetical protein [Roseovarius sp.]
MSFRPAPIVEQPVQKFACKKPENLDQKARDYLDRVHLLPRFIRHRESVSRRGNPFNKRITKSGKVKAYSQLENQPGFQPRALKCQHTEVELTNRFLMIFLSPMALPNLCCISAPIACKELLPLTQIAHKRVQASENILGDL